MSGNEIDPSKLIQEEAEFIRSAPWVQEVEINAETLPKEHRPEGNKMFLKIYPQKVISSIKINALISQIKIEDREVLIANESRDMDPSFPDLFNKYNSLIISIICQGYHNAAGDPPSWLRNFFIQNFTWNELYIILNAIIYRLGNLAFIESTDLIQRTGPQTKEIIALAENLRTWTRENRS